LLQRSSRAGSAKEGGPTWGITISRACFQAHCQCETTASAPCRGAQGQLSGLTSEFGATARSAQSMLGGLFGRKRAPAAPAPDPAPPDPSPKLLFGRKAPAAAAAEPQPARAAAAAGRASGAPDAAGGTGSRSDMPPSVLARLAGSSSPLRVMSRGSGTAHCITRTAHALGLNCHKICQLSAFRVTTCRSLTCERYHQGTLLNSVMGCPSVIAMPPPISVSRASQQLTALARR